MTTALITGGAGGIGLEFVQLLAKDGYDLIVVDRVQEQLDDVGQILAKQHPSLKYFPLAMDLSVPNAAELVHEYCEAQNLSIGVLINNVGFGALGEHVEQNTDLMRNMLAVNNLLLTNMCLLFGKSMKAAQAGYILNVASMVGFSPSPYFTAYSATKAFTLHFSVALARELKEYGVTVSCLCPGTTKTKFLDVAQTGDAKASGITDFVSRFMTTPDIVAAAGYRGLFKKKLIVLPTFFLYVQSLVLRAVPMPLTSWFVYKKTK